MINLFSKYSNYEKLKNSSENLSIANQNNKDQLLEKTESQNNLNQNFQTNHLGIIINQDNINLAYNTIQNFIKNENCSAILKIINTTSKNQPEDFIFYQKKYTIDCFIHVVIPMFFNKNIKQITYTHRNEKLDILISFQEEIHSLKIKTIKQQIINISYTNNQQINTLTKLELQDINELIQYKPTIFQKDQKIDLLDM